MRWIDFRIEMVHSNIDGNRKAYRIASGVFLLNAFLCLWNAINIYSGVIHHEWIAGLGAGCTGISAIWTWLTLWDIRQSIRLDKEMLACLDKMKDDEMKSGVTAQYENTIEYYKNCVKDMQGREKAASPQPMGSDDPAKP
jgi:hypothetical protein